MTYENPIERCIVRCGGIMVTAMSAAEALAHVEGGIMVAFPHPSTEPLALTEALWQRAEKITGLNYANERVVMLPRIAPLSREMIMCFIAGRVLGLSKSY